MHAATLVRLHTGFAAAAFISALAIGSHLHFYKIVKNDVAQYPDEFFPSVSATIGDWFPERNIFQILIALTAGPRFALVFLQYFLHYASSPALATIVFFSGLVRTLSCGGWVYITSSDDHDVHDFMMILYMVCNLPWMIGTIAATPSTRVSVIRKRKMIAAGFFISLVPLIYFFIQHKVHRVPGAYTMYAYFEWSLIFFDVFFDSVAEQEFAEADLKISLTAQFDKPASMDQPLADALDAALAPAPKHSDEALKIPLMDIISQQWASFVDPWSKTIDAICGRDIVSFVSDVYLAYIFWTLFTALIPTLFYFSVWELGIAGHELAFLSVLSPALLTLTVPYYYIFGDSVVVTKPARTAYDFLCTRSGQIAFHLASLIGLAAYPVPSPGGRLLLVASANAIAMIRQSVAWAGLVEGEGDVGYQGTVLGLGILLSSVLKMANSGNNPVWPFINHKADGWNNTGILLALLAIYEYSTRVIVPVAPSGPEPKSKILPFVKRFFALANNEDARADGREPKGKRKATKSTKSAKAEPEKEKGPEFEPPISILRAALPLGALLFSVHNLLGDPSTLIAWSWTGYENGEARGPQPHFFGAFTVVAMAVGLGVGQYQPNHTPTWFELAIPAFYVMYAFRDWTGCIAGMCVAVFLMSLLPGALDHAARGIHMHTSGENAPRVAKVYTTALGVYCVLTLASIFTVAYAFVPGGNLLRERTGLVTIVQMVMLFPMFKLGGAAVVATKARALANRTYVFRALMIFPILALFATLSHTPSSLPQPYRPEARIVRAGIWAVHFGIDNEGHDSQRGMLRVMQDMELDIIGLLETDLHRQAFGHRDLTRRMVEEGNYYVDSGPGPNQHTWGCVLLSKFPIISSKHHLLPSPHGELAPAIEAVLDMFGTEVLVIVSHNGQEEDPLDRELQATALAEIMKASTRPVIFLGYVVSKPHEGRPSPYGIMVGEGNVHDIDDEDMDRWCEYIFYRGVYRTSYARLSRGIITDTETQIGQFVIPPPGMGPLNDTREARYLRTRKEVLPEVHWFPMEYYGNEQTGGVNGHYYHVFNTPLYYLLPEEGNAIEA